MKRLVIQREPDTDEGTFSLGMLNEGEQRLGWWNFIELPWRDNIPERSRVIAGVYEAVLIDSPHFKRKVYALQNVPGRSAVEMHPANFAGDVANGWSSDLKGCCAPGMDRGMLTNRAGIAQHAILQSARALDEIEAICGAEPIEIEFRDPPDA